MTKILLLILLIFTTTTSTAEEEIHLPFSEENAKYWKYISDRTMGGISDGQDSLEM